MRNWLLTLITIVFGTAHFCDAKLGSSYDLCMSPSNDGILEALKKNSLPRGGKKAGKYRLVEEWEKQPVDTVLKCVEACCGAASYRCDVALFRKVDDEFRCFALTCDESQPDGCDASTNPRYKDSLMIRLRRQTPSSDKNKAPKKPRDRLCSPDNRQAFCPKGELCRPNSTDGAYICICPTGYRRVPSAKSDYGVCQPLATAPKANPRQVQTCEYGLGECDDNEVCVVRTRLSKGGVCRCARGFVRDDDGRCVAHQAATMEPPPMNGTSSYGNASLPLTTKSPMTVNGSAKSNVTEGARSGANVTHNHSVLKLNTSRVPSPSPSPPSHPSPRPAASSLSTATPVPSSVSSSTSQLPTTPPPAPGTTKKTKKPKEATDQSDELPRVTMEPLQKLKILLDPTYSIQLPKNELTLHAKVEFPPETTKEKLTYHWSLVSLPTGGGEKGVADGKASPDLHLSKLIVGEYEVKLSVQGRHSYGERSVKVNVVPAKRENQPPVAIVKSPTEVIQLPNNLVLDGTRSSDDDKIVAYNWEEVSGPLGRQDLKGTNKDIVELKSLTPGNYVFRLTVTDSDGATNSTTVNVTIVKEKDYPPIANAGQTVVLSLPDNSVTLNGNASTDDHGIKSYQWVKVGNDKLPADMQGVRTPVLHLSHLERGDYEFQLKVTDTAGQSSTANVKVYVNPRQNKAPTARAGGQKTVTLPLQETELDGSKSKDDDKIVRYEWTMISGTHQLTINNADKPKALISNLKVGRYKFRLKVWDKEKLEGEDTMVLTVQESQNYAPKANAGDDQLVLLPQNLVRLDGSRSTDDKKIEKFEWSRTGESLAAGTILNGSQHAEVLLLTDLVPGKYTFNLWVADREGLHSTDQVNLIVKEDKNLKNVLEIRFKGNLQMFTESNKKDFINQFKLLISKSFPNGEIQVHVEKLWQIYATGSIVMRFYVTKKMRATVTVLPGVDVLKVLRHRLSSGVALLDLVIERVDTAVCQTNCSGHGRCHPITRECVCEAFWMENSFRVRYGDGEHNCDWSILYVIVLSCVGVLVVALAVWLVIWCRRRWRRPRLKRHKYTLLNEFDEKDGGMKLLSGLPARNGKGKSRRSSGGPIGPGGPDSGMVASESDLTSDEEETLFVNKRPVNGGVGSAVGNENKAYLRSNGVAGAL